MRTKLLLTSTVLLALMIVGCGDAPCSGSACNVVVKPPPDATTTPNTDWQVAATTKDCANNGAIVEADNKNLNYAQEESTLPKHTPNPPGVAMHTNAPILLWRGACNKSAAPTGDQTVTWSRALCVSAQNCPSPTALGTSTVKAQAQCTCQPIFFEDHVGDSAGEVPGLYRYAASFNGVEIANLIVSVVQ